MWLVIKPLSILVWDCHGISLRHTFQYIPERKKRFETFYVLMLSASTPGSSPGAVALTACTGDSEDKSREEQRERLMDEDSDILDALDN